MLHRDLLILTVVLCCCGSLSAAEPVLIVMEEQADLAAAEYLPTKEAKGRFVYEELRAVAERSQPPVLELLREAGVEHRAFYVSNLVWAETTPELRQQISQLDGVARVVESPQGRIERPVPSRELRPKKAIEWNLQMIRADDAWTEGITGQGSVVGSVDTGAIFQHPGIKNQYRGWDGVTADHNYNWHDAIHGPATSCDGDSPFPCDPDGHGTHTIGTMVGDDGGSNQIGVAPGAKWISCRCWEPVKRTDLVYVMECLQWMLAPTDLSGNNPSPDLAPHVINNSWFCEPSEGCTDPNALLAIVQNLRSAGIVVVASAGNDGPGESTIQYPPAIYQDTFTVGAVHPSEGIASFSSRGPVTIDGSFRLKPDVVAPGVSVRSAVVGSGYAAWDGTSMASPHVAGTVALMVSAVPDLAGEVSLMERVLRRQAFGSGTANNAYGWGRVDAWRAVQDFQAIVSNGGDGDEDPLPERPLTFDDALLAQNRPNPFNPLTEIEFELREAAEIRVDVFDASGRKVRSLISGRQFAAGPHRVRWDGLDDRGNSAVSGVYYCRLESENFTRTRKMALIR